VRAILPLEELEDRRLCSVTVSQGWTGYFTIQGTPAADSINVSVNRSTGTFTVDGVTYAGVQYLSVVGGDGNDNVDVSGTGSGSLAASISGGAGDDTLSLNFDGGIWGGDGNDTINLTNAYRGAAIGEAGSDLLTISGDCIDPQVSGGDGDDGIDAAANHYGVVMRGDAGDDAVIGSPYADELYGGEGVDMMFGGSGNDIIYVQDAGSADWVWGGDGWDTMYGNVSDIIADGSVEVVYRA
jgi:hypothetical protein